MTKTQIAFAALFASSVIAGAAIGFAQPEAKPPVVANHAAPIFPAEKAKPVKFERVPTGAQWRVRRGKAFAYVACDASRSWPNGQSEHRCLTYSKAKGWGKAVKWIPSLSLLPLTGDLPVEPVAKPL